MPSIKSTLKGRQFFEMAFLRDCSIKVGCVITVIYSQEYTMYSSSVERRLDDLNVKYT